MNNELSLDTLDQVSGGGLEPPKAFEMHLQREHISGIQLLVDMQHYDALYAKQFTKARLLSARVR